MMNAEVYFDIRYSLFLVRYSKKVQLFVYHTLRLIDRSFCEPFL
jgi:hypothetical protein